MSKPIFIKCSVDRFCGSEIAALTYPGQYTKTSLPSRPINLPVRLNSILTFENRIIIEQHEYTNVKFPRITFHMVGSYHHSSLGEMNKIVWWYPPTDEGKRSYDNDLELLDQFCVCDADREANLNRKIEYYDTFG